MKYLKIALALVVVILVACATSPLGRKQLTLLPNAQLDQMGQQAFQEMQKQQKPLKNERVQAYVECIVNALLKNVEGTKPEEWQTTVFDDESPNAFALPGNRIGVHSGMFKIARTPSQLAAVIGHEIGHVIAHHGNERMSQALAVQGGVVAGSLLLDIESPRGQLILAALGLGAQVGYLLPYSRVQEREADLVGLKLMAQSGFEPEAAVELWENMRKAGGAQPPEFLSTHPAHQTRIDRLKENLRDAEEFYRQARAKGDIPSCPAPRL